jgi:uncharacterized protein (TIGR02265 family)
MTQADLERRIDATGPEDWVRGIVFNSAFELVRRLSGDGVACACDPDGTGIRRDFHSYHAADFLRVVAAAARELARAHGGTDAAFAALGARMWRDVSRSVVGRTLASLADGDPRRLLEQIPDGYRAVVSYGERTVSWEGEREARLRFDRDLLVAPFHCGVVSAALEAAGARGVRASGRDVGFLAAEVEVSWR